MKPGPGAYNIKGVVGTEKLGKTLTGRPDTSKSHTTLSPGPGAYNANYRTAIKTSPGWKIGTSRRDEDVRQARQTGHFPNPGSYDPSTA